MSSSLYNTELDTLLLAIPQIQRQDLHTRLQCVSSLRLHPLLHTCPVPRSVNTTRSKYQRTNYKKEVSVMQRQSESASLSVMIVQFQLTFTLQVYLLTLQRGRTVPRTVHRTKKSRTYQAMLERKGAIVCSVKNILVYFHLDQAQNISIFNGHLFPALPYLVQCNLLI